MSEAVPISVKTSAPANIPKTGSILQRACACGKHTNGSAECEECRKKRMNQERTGQLQRAAIGSGPATAPSIVHDMLRTSGHPLDASTRAYMEARFGHDFSRVRVHADAVAAESARAVNALAYTVGSHVVFAKGQYAPSSSGGRDLLAHELAHVIQQGERTPGSEILLNDAFEADAVAFSRHVLGRPATSGWFASGEHVRFAPVSLQRQEAPFERLYTITLRPGLSIEQAPLERAQRFLRTQLVNLLRGYAEGKRDTHQFLIDLRQESAINRYFVAPISETLGGVALPPITIWNEVFRLIDGVEAAVNAGEIDQALRAATTAEEAYARASQLIRQYREGIETGGGRAVTGLEFIRNASVVVVGAGATIASGGVAAGALIGTAYGTTVTVTQEATELNLGLRQEIDWDQIAFDALLGFVLAYAGGRIGGSIANRIAGGRIGGAVADRILRMGGNAAWASFGRETLARIISNAIVGRGAAVVSVVAHALYEVVRGQPLTLEQFADRLAEQLSLSEVAMDIFYGEIANAATSPGRPTSPDGETSPPIDLAAARARSQAQQQAAQTSSGSTRTRAGGGRSRPGASGAQARRSPVLETEGNAALQARPEFEVPAPEIRPASEPIAEPEPTRVLQFPIQPRAPGVRTGVGLGLAAVPRTRPRLTRRSRRQSECQIEPAFPLGGNAEHDALAAHVTGAPVEYIVTTPEGLSARYDGKDAIDTLYEIKTRHDFLNLLDQPEARLGPAGRRVLSDAVPNLMFQFHEQALVAAECGYEFRIATNNPNVLQILRELAPPGVHVELVHFPWP